MVMLKWSSRAKKDLRIIYKWYTKQAGEKIANRIVGDIRSAACLLTTHPHLGYFEPMLEEFPQNFRTLVDVPNYKIVYWVENDIVKVATVFDCRQRPGKIYQIINGRTDWVCEPQIEYK